MYELANSVMNTRQIKALTYHDGKVCNGVIKENTKVYVYLPKLSLKWTRSVRIIKENHTSYLIEHQSNDKWLQNGQQGKN